MGARSKARKRALDLLYEADVREISLNSAIAVESERDRSDAQRAASWDYARTIVEGIAQHGDEIDELIESYSQGWTIGRMPVIDRAIVRIAMWEILFNSEVPAAVAISEAVQSATSYSTADSAGFVNGLLGKIAHLNT